MCPAEDPISEPQVIAERIVLVVEDEVLIRLAVADQLRDCGFKVVEAANGAEAQSLILAGVKPDVVFSDISMPSVDGVAFCRWLIAEGIETPVILTSGVPTALAQAGEVCTNVRAMIEKPYDYDAVVNQIRSVLKPA